MFLFFDHSKILFFERRVSQDDSRSALTLKNGSVSGGVGVTVKISVILKI